MSKTISRVIYEIFERPYGYKFKLTVSDIKSYRARQTCIPYENRTLLNNKKKQH